MRGSGHEGKSLLGVSRGGAADPLALQIGNRLVGNRDGALAIELTLNYINLLFEAPSIIAVTGGESGDAPAWTPYEVRAGDFVEIRRSRGGARHYICIRGGISGDDGVTVRSGDSYSLVGEPAMLPARTPLAWRPFVGGLIRATAGLQAERFGADFWEHSWRVLPESGRRGIRLAGDAVVMAELSDILTEGVLAGDIQVPPDGQPIVLGVDQQTTGGYPKIASVITADLWKLGQLRAGDRIRFEQVSFAEALDLLAEQERRLRAIQ